MNLLEKCHLDVVEEKKKQNQKKMDERNLFKDILIDVESSHKKKLVVKKKIKQDDKVYLDYNSFVKDKSLKSKYPTMHTELDNSTKILSTIDINSANDILTALPIKSIIKSRIHSLQSSEEQDKFHRDKNSKIDISKVIENEKLLKKHFLINEMIDSLQSQVLIKKQKQYENKISDKRYVDLMLRNIEDYKKEKELVNQANKDKYSKYKTELKTQINNKYDEQKPAITEIERNYNKNIMIKLNNL